MQFEVHPYAAHFPLMDDAAISRLADSIKRNGLREPIKLRKSDKLLIDGRNRLAACELAKVTPETELIDVDELATLELIADLNIDRRHLTEGQQQVAAAEFAKRREEALVMRNVAHNSDGPKNRGRKESVQEAAEKFGVGARTIENVRVAIEADPENAKRIASGEVSAHAAAKAARAKKSEPKKSVDDTPKDKLNHPIPEHLRPVFSDMRFGEIDGFFGRMRDTLKSLASSPAGFHLQTHLSNQDKYLVNGFEEIRYQLLDDGRPHCVCVNCDGSGKKRLDKCPSCKGCGWLTKYKYNQVKRDAEAEASIRK